MLRLVAYLPNEVRRHPLAGATLTIGSDPSNDVCLPLPGVAARHARLDRRGERVTIHNLVARTRLLVNGRPVDEAVIAVLDELKVGEVTLLLEDSMLLEPSEETRSAAGDVARRPGPAGFNRFLERLAGLSRWVVSDLQSRASVESVLLELLKDLGGGALFLFQTSEGDPPVVRLAVCTIPGWLADLSSSAGAIMDRLVGEASSLGRVRVQFGITARDAIYRRVRALDRDYCLLAVLDSEDGIAWSPDLGFAAIADLVVLGLIHHVGRYEPLLPGRADSAELTLAPGFVCGPAPATRHLLDQLRRFADSTAHVVLRGEPGSGRELVARTLHLSGPRRHGPFVVVRGDVAPQQLEVELFGVEVAGRAGATVRREPKVGLAHSGTLFLDAIEGLPLDLQGRLVQVLRDGRSFGPGVHEISEVDVRFMVSTTRSLMVAAERGTVRVDLAVLLSQFSVHVPALRERQDDLPLLVQTLVNRFSHESGKRVRGITLDTLAALATHSFPGNLRELENAVRQMLYLAAPDAPLDIDLLPPEIRTAARYSTMNQGERSEFDLQARVAQVERQTILEALRSTRGNKTKAARLLNVSRSGLAEKLRRHGL